MWDDENAAASFAETHPLAQRLRGQRLPRRPASATGVRNLARSAGRRAAYEGDAAQRARDRHDARSAADEPDASVPPSQSGQLSERPSKPTALCGGQPLLARLAGRSCRQCPYGAAMKRRPPTPTPMQHAGHPQAIARQRRKDFHHESAFIRYAIVSTSGTLPVFRHSTRVPRGRRSGVILRVGFGCPLGLVSTADLGDRATPGGGARRRRR